MGRSRVVLWLEPLQLGAPHHPRLGCIPLVALAQATAVALGGAVAARSRGGGSDAICVADSLLTRSCLFLRSGADAQRRMELRPATGLCSLRCPAVGQLVAQDTVRRPVSAHGCDGILASRVHLYSDRGLVRATTPLARGAGAGREPDVELVVASPGLARGVRWPAKGGLWRVPARSVGVRSVARRARGSRRRTLGSQALAAPGRDVEDARAGSRSLCSGPCGLRMERVGKFASFGYVC